MSDFEDRLTALRQRFLLRLGEDRRALQTEATTHSNASMSCASITVSPEWPVQSACPAELGARTCEAALIAQPSSALTDLVEFRSSMDAMIDANPGKGEHRSFISACPQAH
jgi:hypothetical protein